MSRGFTLAELVVVVAIAGVLAVAAIVATPSPTDANLMAAARQVQSDIEYAKQNAMTTGTTSGVSFTANGSYTVYQGTTATPLTSPLTLSNMVITLSTNFPGISISNSYVVQFNNLGAPTTGGGSSVTLTNGTTTHKVNVTNNTGMVFIQ
jgi:prepilin-type N-terminal cleavage/methylation domain-containing protein